MKNLTNRELKGYLSGYLLSDGCRFTGEYLANKKYLANRYWVSGIQKDKDFIERIVYILNTIYDADVKIRKRRIRYNDRTLIYYAVQTQKKQIYYATAELIRAEWIEKQNWKTKIQILRALFDGDGGISLDERIKKDGDCINFYYTISVAMRFGNTDKKVINIYIKLLNYFNVPYKIYPYYKGRKKPLYEIRCSGKNAEALHEVIKPLIQRKERKIQEYYIKKREMKK